MWFNSKDKRERMEFIQNFRPTSKAQLLQVAMWYHKGDTEKAQQMVDFYTKNMDLPDFDPAPPTWQENTKNTINGFMGWIKENQDTLAQGYQFIQEVVARRGLPPITTPTEPVNPLPSINE